MTALATNPFATPTPPAPSRKVVAPATPHDALAPTQRFADVLKARAPAETRADPRRHDADDGRDEHDRQRHGAFSSADLPIAASHDDTRPFRSSPRDEKREEIARTIDTRDTMRATSRRLDVADTRHELPDAHPRTNDTREPMHAPSRGDDADPRQDASGTTASRDTLRATERRPDSAGAQASDGTSRIAREARSERHDVPSNARDDGMIKPSSDDRGIARSGRERGEQSADVTTRARMSSASTVTHHFGSTKQGVQDANVTSPHVPDSAHGRAASVASVLAGAEAITTAAYSGSAAAATPSLVASRVADIEAPRAATMDAKVVLAADTTLAPSTIPAADAPGTSASQPASPASSMLTLARMLAEAGAPAAASGAAISATPRGDTGAAVSATVGTAVDNRQLAAGAGAQPHAAVASSLTPALAALADASALLPRGIAPSASAASPSAFASETSAGTAAQPIATAAPSGTITVPSPTSLAATPAMSAGATAMTAANAPRATPGGTPGTAATPMPSLLSSTAESASPFAIDAPMTLPTIAALPDGTIGTVATLLPSTPGAALTAPTAPAGPSLADAALAPLLDTARDAQWLDRLALDISRAADVRSNMRFQLSPEHLGNLAVELARTEEGTRISLTTDNEGAHRLMTEAQPQLVAEARAQGLRVSEAQVNLDQRGAGSGDAGRGFAQTASQSGGQQPGGDQRQPQPRAAAQRATARTTSATTDERFA